MTNFLKKSVQSFLSLNEIKRSIDMLCPALIDYRKALLTPEPALATVTILCDSPGDNGKRTRRTFGGEVFLYPGQQHTLKIPYTQHVVANCTYFVSGHPNIVLTNFLVGHDSKFASDCGV